MTIFKVISEKRGDVTDRFDWFVTTNGGLYYFDTMTGGIEPCVLVLDRKKEEGVIIFTIK